MSKNDKDHTTTTIRLTKTTKKYLDEFKDKYGAKNLEKATLALIAYFYNETGQQWQNVSKNFAHMPNPLFDISDLRRRVLIGFYEQPLNQLYITIENLVYNSEKEEYEG